MQNEIKYADLFGGVGGFRLGIERATNNKLQSKESEQADSRSGGKWNSNEQGTLFRPPNNTTSCVFYCDIDKYAVQTYNKNFGENHRPTDITTVKADSIPDIDMLCGGFPCQTFSIAGKRKGFEDTRGTMFYEIVRILKAKRPKIVFLENVKGLLSHDRGRTFAIILSSLAELGYDVQWMVLNSKFFGVPQNRERVFIIGSLRGTSRPEILPFGKSGEEIDQQQSGVSFLTVFSSQHKIARGMPMIKVGTLDGAGWEKRHESIRRVYGTNGTAPTIPTGTGGGVMTKVAIPTLTPDRPEKRQNGRRFKEDGEPSFTLTGQDVHGVMMGTITEAVGNRAGSSKEFLSSVEKIHRETMQIRRLTPIECERLQGFPDNWTEGVSDTQRYKQMGNAVTVNVIQAIAERLLESFNKTPPRALNQAREVL